MDGRVEVYLADERPQTILDLGSGTGRLATGLADAFGGPAYGVEPSDRPRALRGVRRVLKPGGVAFAAAHAS
ncbi:class I SAM-dependent methyltransferase [Kribbella turkmenica]|uniref:Class I SAM-dependent methyltransferase n=1 Tax=Kribbella turkmenica TaxID=2530375 RepID=A0A4R4WK90_9ACTN|nr:class I SAM-dependent methyltransferase [Kribbella turkmenica]TDD16934.1 class I SAM-dependent methyltransferase [Kribbella turkmenica]